MQAGQQNCLNSVWQTTFSKTAHEIMQAGQQNYLNSVWQTAFSIHDAQFAKKSKLKKLVF